MSNEYKGNENDRLPVFGDPEESFAARLLIKIGIKNNDKETKRIGQARLRILEGRGKVEGYEVLNMEIPRDLPNK